MRRQPNPPRLRPLRRAGRWVTASPANMTFAGAWAGILFTVVFWTITDRLEPTFVATFGGLLTASGLLAGRQQEPPRPLPGEPTAPSLTEDGDA